MNCESEDDDMPPDLIALSNEDFEGEIAKRNHNLNSIDQTPSEREIKSILEIESNSGTDFTTRREYEDIKLSSIKKVPVTILTGFLGSGKSTLLNHILTSPDHGFRIAVIENEFAKGLGIESAIVKDGVDGDTLFAEGEIIELNNGCICCSVKNDLIITLENLLKYKAENKGKSFDYIIIEASGMANPGPIAACLWMDEELESQLKLDAVVTLVDTVNIHRHLPNLLPPSLYQELATKRDSNENLSEEIEKNSLNVGDGSNKEIAELSCIDEAFKQVAYADRILLNKIDLLKTHKISDEYLEYIKDHISNINTVADIYQTTYSNVNVEAILNVDAYAEDHLLLWNIKNDNMSLHAETSLNNNNNTAIEVRVQNNEQGNRSMNNFQLQLSLSHHKHDIQVTSTVITNETFLINIEKLRQWVADLLWMNIDVKTNYDGHTEDHDPMKTIIVEDVTKKTAMEIFRIKGLFETSSQELYLLQGVYDTFDIKKYTFNQIKYDHENEKILSSAVDEASKSSSRDVSHEWNGKGYRLVVIGKNILHDELKHSLEKCT